MILMQVVEEKRILRERIKHLGAEAGIGRMESALFERQSKFSLKHSQSSFKQRRTGGLLQLQLQR